MSYIERSIPPGDRDDAPLELPLAPASTPLPPLTDTIDASRIERIGMHLADAQRNYNAALVLLAQHRHADFRIAMSGAAANLTEAAPLARLLSNPPRSRA